MKDGFNKVVPISTSSDETQLSGESPQGDGAPLPSPILPLPVVSIEGPKGESVEEEKKPEKTEVWMAESASPVKAGKRSDIEASVRENNLSPHQKGVVVRGKETKERVGEEGKTPEHRRKKVKMPPIALPRSGSVILARGDPQQRIKVLKPNSWLRSLWDFLILIFVLYNTVVIPLTLAYARLLDKNVLSAMEGIDIAVDVFFTLDIILSFFTAYTNSRGELITDNRMIAKKYLRTFFAIDVLAVLPFDLFESLFRTADAQDVNLATRWIPLLKLPRLLRLSRVMRLLDRFEFANVWKIIRLLFVLIMIAHFLACLWYLLVEYDELWWEPYIQAAQLHNVTLFGVTSVSSVNASTLHAGDMLGLAETYAICLYNAFIMLVGSDSLPTTLGQRMFASFALTVGALFSAIIFGSMAVLITNFNAARTRFNQTMDEVNANMRYLELPPKLQSKIRGYFEHMYHTNKDITGQRLFDTLNPTVRYEIAEHLHREMVKNAPLFQACHPFFIKDIVTRLRAEVYMKGENIIEEGDTGQEMFFVSRGTVDIMVKRVKVTVIEEGGFFGEIALLLRTRRTAAARANTICELQVLTKHDFNSVLLKYPRHRETFIRLAKKRKDRNASLNDKALIAETFRSMGKEDDDNKSRKSFRRRRLEGYGSSHVMLATPTPSFDTNHAHAMLSPRLSHHEQGEGAERQGNTEAWRKPPLRPSLDAGRPSHSRPSVDSDEIVRAATAEKGKTLARLRLNIPSHLSNNAHREGEGESEKEGAPIGEDRSERGTLIDNSGRDSLAHIHATLAQLFDVVDEGFFNVKRRLKRLEAAVDVGLVGPDGSESEGGSDEMEEEGRGGGREGGDVSVSVSVCADGGGDGGRLEDKK